MSTSAEGSVNGKYEGLNLVKCHRQIFLREYQTLGLLDLKDAFCLLLFLPFDGTLVSE